MLGSRARRALMLAGLPLLAQAAILSTRTFRDERRELSNASPGELLPTNTTSAPSNTTTADSDSNSSRSSGDSFPMVAIPFIVVGGVVGILLFYKFCLEGDDDEDEDDNGPSTTTQRTKAATSQPTRTVQPTSLSQTGIAQAPREPRTRQAAPKRLTARNLHRRPEIVTSAQPVASAAGQPSRVTVEMASAQTSQTGVYWIDKPRERERLDQW